MRKYKWILTILISLILIQSISIASIALIRWSWRSCAPTDMTLVWCCRPAPATVRAFGICRLGFATAPLRWTRRWRLRLAGCWRFHMAAIWPARTGVTWDGSPVLPIKSPLDAHSGRYAPWVKLVHARVGFGATRRSVAAVRQTMCATTVAADLALPHSLDSRRAWPHQR